MSQNRETATDRLASIIQLIQIGRRTGTLTTRRGEGITQEQGTITFLKGQITTASLGRHSGAEALNRLSIWGHCRFIFISTEEADNLPFSPFPIARQERNSHTGAISRQMPMSPNPEPSSNNSQTHRALNGASVMIPGVPYCIRPLDDALRMIDNLGLTRAHRRILLLIDGQRSMIELGRLTGKTGRDIAEILRDLEQAAVIRFPGGSAKW
jgi:hypothetical protein